MRLVLALVMILPTLASAGEHSVPQPPPLVAKVSRVGTEFIQFEVCENGKCEPLAGETGIFRLSDLEARLELLANESPEIQAAWAARQKLFNLAGAVGAGTVVLGNVSAMFLWSRGLGLPALHSALAGDAGLIPLTLAVWMKFMIRPLDERARRANGHALRSAMVEEFETENDAVFRHNISRVRAALHGIETVGACEPNL